MHSVKTVWLKPLWIDSGLGSFLFFKHLRYLIYLESDVMAFIRPSICFRGFFPTLQSPMVPVWLQRPFYSVTALICAVLQQSPAVPLGCLHYAQNANISIKGPLGKTSILWMVRTVACVRESYNYVPAFLYSICVKYKTQRQTHESVIFAVSWFLYNQSWHRCFWVIDKQSNISVLTISL